MSSPQTLLAGPHHGLEEEQVLEERRQPYTPQQVRLMFPVLTEVDA
jgi:hypothetical protein